MASLDEEGLTYLWEKIKSALSGKVDRVSGKGLSANDYTTAEKKTNWRESQPVRTNMCIQSIKQKRADCTK